MNTYKLLPFYFEVVAGKEILVNEIGDMLILPRGTTAAIVDRRVSSDSDLYKTLHANFFISDQVLHPLFEVYASRLAVKKNHLMTRASLHIFVLTLQCNQNCGYCQATSTMACSTHYSMTRDTLNAAIELMFRSNSNYITMEFQGGEPTLEFELLEYGIKRALTLNEKYNKELAFVVCTNCISLSTEFIELCKKYNVMISTSFDGPKYIHDSNRGCKGSYEKVIDSFQKVRRMLGDNILSALMTTSEVSLTDPKGIINEYIKNGFSSIFLRALNPYGRALNTADWDNYTTKFIGFYKQALDYIIELNQRGVYIREEYATIILRKMLTAFGGGFVDLQSPSGCIQSVLVYNYDGNVYCSDESRMLAENGIYEFMLGSVHDRYEALVYGAKAKQIALFSANECLAGCSQCAFKTYCGADPVRNYATQGELYGNRPHSLYCKKNKAIISYLIELMISKSEIVLPIFKRWLL
jgi:His-Xaa-Ser system radical SAM maturase HxsB